MNNRQKAYQRAQQAYEAAQRLGNRLRETAGRLTTSEWITAIFTTVIAAATIWNVFVVKGSLVILQGQLDEMKAAREGGDKSMADQMTVMRDQAKAMQGQFEAVLAAQRPWISVTPTITSFDMDEFPGAKRYVMLWVKFAMHNDGRETAQNIQIQREIIPYNGNPRFLVSLETTQEALCSEASKLASHPVGNKGQAILPGAEGSEIIDMETRGNLIIPDKTLFLVYGCVDYSYPPDRHGQTLFQYVLGTPNGEYPGPIPFRADVPASPIPPLSAMKKGSIQPSEVDLRKERYGRNEIR